MTNSLPVKGCFLVKYTHGKNFTKIKEPNRNGRNKLDIQGEKKEVIKVVK